MTTDEQYISRCLQLALLGKGHVAPNPMVGAVIVHNDKIIGEGYHQQYGEAHAEVNAVNSVEDTSLLSESTIYVSLEPCAHFGKTPPCANLIIEKQFKHVVVGARDPHSKVDGKGTQRIRNAGIEIVTGVLEEECRAINKHFFTQHEQQRPYVFLKWAQTENGLMDNAAGQQGEVSWISGPEVQTKVHQWRSEYQTILVGKNTVKQDNPSLTVRAIEGKNPTRIVLDSLLQLAPDYNVFNQEAPTIILNTVKDASDNHPAYLKLDELTPENILKALYQRGIQSVLIEGGSQTLSSFIASNLWDEAKVIVGQNEFKAGTLAPTLKTSPVKVENCFGDKIYSYFNI